MRPPPTRIGNGGRYLRTNASMGPESTSSDTPAISKSLRSNSRYSSAMCGNSSRQGSHHDAQKFTSVTLPRNARSEEHTSELQSLAYLVCRLLLEKKKKNT